MPTLSHGSDLALAPTIKPIAHALGTSPRQAMQQIAELGFDAIQLDATMQGLRPRELDGTARRDLVAILRRTGLRAGGLDFFIPADHYTDPEHVDRAVQSACAAITLAGDIGRVPVSLNIPPQGLEPRVIDELTTVAQGCGVWLAMHGSSDAAEFSGWLGEVDSDYIGAGMDPAALLAARYNPVESLEKLSARLFVARLSDARKGQADGSRCAAGQGDLDLSTYRVWIDIAPRRLGPVVLDLRQLSSPVAAAQSGQAAWQAAAVKL